MANTHQFETKFSKRMQATFYNLPIFRAIVNYEEKKILADGQSVVRPRKPRLIASNYTRGSDMSFQTITEGVETLTVNTAKVSPFPLDDLDKIQSKYKLMNDYADDGMRVLNNAVDADVLGEYSNAIDTVDAGDIGGTVGDPLTLTTSNYFKVLSKAVQKLREQNVDITGKMELAEDLSAKLGIKGLVGSGFGVVSPQMAQIAEETGAGRETMEGDRIGINGYTRSQMGFDCYLSNNLAWSAVLAMSIQPTNGDVLTIGGVTFTAVSVIGSTAGNYLIGADVDATRANLTALINNPETTSSTQVALSNTRVNIFALSDREKIDQLVATNDNTANTMSLVGEGVSYFTLTEAFTSASNVWQKETQHQLFGHKGAIDVVIQAEPQVQISDIPAQLGKYVKPYVLYGLKTFNEGARQMIDVQINSAAF